MPEDFIISENDPTKNAELLYNMRFVKNIISGCHLRSFAKPNSSSLISNINIYSSLSSKTDKRNYHLFNETLDNRNELMAESREGIFFKFNYDSKSKIPPIVQLVANSKNEDDKKLYNIIFSNMSIELFQKFLKQLGKISIFEGIKSIKYLFIEFDNKFLAKKPSDLKITRSDFKAFQDIHRKLILSDDRIELFKKWVNIFKTYDVAISPVIFSMYYNVMRKMWDDNNLSGFCTTLLKMKNMYDNDYSLDNYYNACCSNYSNNNNYIYNYYTETGLTTRNYTEENNIVIKAKNNLVENFINFLKNKSDNFFNSLDNFLKIELLYNLINKGNSGEACLLYSMMKNGDENFVEYTMNNFESVYRTVLLLSRYHSTPSNDRSCMEENLKFLYTIIREYSENVTSCFTDVANYPINIIDKAFEAETLFNVSYLKKYITREFIKYFHKKYGADDYILYKPKVSNNKTKNILNIFQKILKGSRGEIFLSSETVNFITDLKKYYVNSDNNTEEVFLKFYLMFLFKAGFSNGIKNISRTCFLEILIQSLKSKSSSGENVFEIIKSLVKFSEKFNDEKFMLWLINNNMSQYPDEFIIQRYIGEYGTISKLKSDTDLYKVFKSFQKLLNNC